MGALRAKLGGRRKLGPTVCAHARQRGRTLLAELRASTVLVLAPRTLHCEPRHPPEFDGRERNRASGGRRRLSAHHTKPSCERAATSPQGCGKGTPNGSEGSLRL